MYEKNRTLVGTLSMGMVVAMTMMLGKAARGETVRIYVGTYTSGASKGIYLLDLDYDTGRVHPRGLAAETKNPSFLALHPAGDYLYAVNEVGDFQGKSSGGVSAFQINRTSGMLTFLNELPSSGADPCHLVVDADGRNVLLANYTGGSVAVLSLAADGRLAKQTSFVQHQGAGASPRQTAPHAHSINLGQSNKFAFVADLGLDRVITYGFDAQLGSLKHVSDAAVPPGSGPRHFAIHPREKFAYAINELSSTISSFHFEADTGSLREFQTISTLPAENTEPNSTADVQVSRDGRFVYGSNRGHDSIAVFAVDQALGTLSLVQVEKTRGKTPRNFGIDPTGRFLLAANQATDNITVFRIDASSGCLESTGQQVSVPSPVCLKFQRLPQVQ